MNPKSEPHRHTPKQNTTSAVQPCPTGHENVQRFFVPFTTGRNSTLQEDVDVERIPEKSGDILEAALAKDWTELLDSPEILRIIRKLPADYIEIIEMLYFENLTQREIAERMSCSQQNIAKKIEKIKKILK